MAEPDTIVKKKTKTKEKIEPPKMYMVILLNDDFTTMEFVVYVIQKVFRKTEDEAASIMLDVHEKGKGVCGVFTLEIAETKAAEVAQEARKEGHPLLAVLEQE